jgi:hypothetical protein
MPESSLQPGESPADALERLWDQGQGPEPTDFVARAGDLSPEDLADVLRVDQRQRWLSDHPVRVESYLARFRSVGEDPDLAVDLIYHEFLLRERRGDQPDPADYERRFPQYAMTLRQQIALHYALAPEAAAKTLTCQANTALAPNEAAGPTRLPEVFGRYRIQRQIGQGGMGAVYLAHDTQLDRTVALKVPRFDGEATHRSIERFYREARIAATFHHPNLCPVFDVGQIDGVHYLTMPYLQGELLSAWLKREAQLPPALAARLTARVARALDVAHTAGVLHRDLKPANIMVLPDQEPVVLDFGLARRERTTDPQLSASGFVLGTPAYMAPEQIGGSSDALGPACDIYSLGAVLYEMLAGCKPFVGTMQDVLRQTLTTPPPPLATRVPGIDPRLEALCLRALAKEPARRFASAAAFAEELEQWLRGDQAVAAPGDTLAPAAWPTKLVARWRLWLPRLPWIAALGVAVLALVVGLLILMRSGVLPADPLPVNSRWEGVFKFRPPNNAYSGEVRLEITGRQGESFVGIYATEAGQWQWEVSGILHASKIDWEFTRIIHEAEPRQVVGRAKVTGRLDGPWMEVQYQDENSVADMTLRRAK